MEILLRFINMENNWPLFVDGLAAERKVLGHVVLHSRVMLGGLILGFVVGVSLNGVGLVNPSRCFSARFTSKTD